MRDDCLPTEGARRCGENQQCATCGFNPDVAAKRKAAIRTYASKPYPVESVTLVNLNDVLTAVDKHIEYAMKRRDEEIRNGEPQDIAYWRGRVDEARSIRDALEKMGGGDDV